MHPYVSESRNRGGLYIACAVAALASAFLFQKASVWADLKLAWWVETPSVLAFYGLYWKAFDLWWWRTRPARWLRFSFSPDLRGEWDASVTTRFEGEQVRAKGAATIKQTSFRLKVSIRWENSTSYSVAGVVQVNPNGLPELIYQYLNRPNVDALPTMHTHRGTAWLEYHSPDELLGEYYSGRDRQQWGHLKLSRHGRTVRSTGV